MFDWFSLDGDSVGHQTIRNRGRAARKFSSNGPTEFVEG